MEKKSKKLIIDTSNLDKQFMLICNKLENLEKISKGYDRKSQLMFAQAAQTRTQFMRFMQVICAQMNNMQQIIAHQKELLGVSKPDLTENNELITKIISENTGVKRP